jgi:DNA (cytosine-5)-methyltransferase 1
MSGNPAPRREAGKDVAGTLSARSQGGGGLGTDFDLAGGLIAHTPRGEGFDASEDGTGRAPPLVSVAFDARQSSVCIYGDHAGPLDTHGYSQSVAFDLRGREGGAQFEGPHDTANIRAASGGSSRSYVATHWAVRRITPMECERLQGFPDGYTAIPGAADGPRYKQLGNSMAVSVMAWIERRLDAALRRSAEERDAA